MDELSASQPLFTFCNYDQDPQKTIIVSGFSESERVKAVQSLGAGAYVKKLYVIEKLGLAVKEELHRSR